jgi:catechol 2,3-dioxygenase-like lactoylglutathione lyase family enzyme
LEFLRPLEADSAAGRLLAAGRGGVHHVAFEVPSIDESLDALRRRGVALQDEHPRPGAADSRVAFLAAEPVGGTSIELVETTRSPRPGD